MAHVGYAGTEISFPRPDPYSQTAALPQKRPDGAIKTEYLDKGIHLPPDVRLERGDEWKHDIIRGQFHEPRGRKIVPIRVSVALLTFALAALLIVLGVVFFGVDQRTKSSN